MIRRYQVCLVLQWLGFIAYRVPLIGSLTLGIIRIMSKDKIEKVSTNLVENHLSRRDFSISAAVNQETERRELADDINLN